MPSGRRKLKEQLKNANKREDEERQKEEERVRLVESEREKEEERRNQISFSTEEKVEIQDEEEQQSLSMSTDKMKELEQQVEKKRKEKKEEEEKRKNKKKEAAVKKKYEEEKLLERKIEEMTEGLRIEAEHAAERKKKEEELDLLGGILEPIEEHSTLNQTKKFQQRAFNEKNLPIRSSSTDSLRTHHNLLARGLIDQRVDSVLDISAYDVPILKHGKLDGTYKFGARILKIQLSATQEPIVQKLLLVDFINKYERVETLRLQGLQSALTTSSMLGLFKA